MTKTSSNSPNTDFLGMSDDDFLQVNSPPEVEAETPVKAEEKPSEENTEPVIQTDDSVESENVAEVEDASSEKDQDEKPEEESEDASSTAGGDQRDTGSEDSPAAPESKGSDTTGSSEDGNGDNTISNADAQKKDDETGKNEAKPESGAEEKPVNYEEFFKQVMAPFKANGRTFELKSPEEVIRLMQMGAGYGRKIQDLQPHLKVLRMLEKHELLDSDKLSFLIDVNQKNPEAIKKIIKDSGIDPLDLNIEDNVSYKPINRAVSDEEMAFQDALSDIQTHEGGQETLKIINQSWDDESKSLLFKQPQILEVIQTQRDNGIYDQIAAEIDKQKILGNIPKHTPFLQAYKIAGDYLQSSNGFKVPSNQAANDPVQQTPPQQVLATRTAAPKAQVKNGEKAAAAASTKTNTARKASTLVNPLAMADDEFLKQFEGRL